MKKVFNHTTRNVTPIVQKRINAIQIGQKMQDLPEELWHKSFRFYVKEDPTRRGGPNLRIIRLDPNQPSLTVTGFIFNKFVHPTENRYITVREAARLQGFPDDILFAGPVTSTQQQVGNAVPVPLAKAIFHKICCYAEQSGIKSPLKALSLFSGAGGLDIGARCAGTRQTQITTLTALDCWSDACETLRGYIGQETNVVEADIASIESPQAFWEEHSQQTDAPDLIYGGPPCQAFSQAGKQKALDDPRGPLVFEFLRFVDNLKPRFFVMENVANIKSVNKGQLFKDILTKMQNIGYNVTASVLCAADFGAPQKRKRTIFIGTRKDLGLCDLPAPTHSASPAPDDLFPLMPYMTVGEAFRGLPPANSRS